MGDRTWIDEGAELWREALGPRAGISERRMFGGLCFMDRGNMLCGVHKGGGMARVGKDAEAQALEIDGVTPMQFTGRRMGGLVECDRDLMEDPERRARLLSLALAFTGTLPAK